MSEKLAENKTTTTRRKSFRVLGCTQIFTKRVIFRGVRSRWGRGRDGGGGLESFDTNSHEVHGYRRRHLEDAASLWFQKINIQEFHHGVVVQSVSQSTAYFTSSGKTCSSSVESQHLDWTEDQWEAREPVHNVSVEKNGEEKRPPVTRGSVLDSS